MEVLWLLMLAVSAVESAKILIVMPVYVKSHYISQRRLGLGLAARGHEVHIITTFTEKNTTKNYHEVVVPETNNWELLGIDPPESQFKMAEDFNFFILQKILYDTGLKHAEFVLKSQPVQKLLAEDHKFDLVISEVFNNPAMNMLAHYYQAPLVLVTTFGNSFHTNFFIRNPLQLSTVLHEYGMVDDPQSFWGRAKNVYYSLTDLSLKYLFYPRFERVAKTLIPNLRQPVPSMEQLVSNASLVLINSHFTADAPTAYLPNSIEVGGLHVEEPKPLPNDLKHIMDTSSEGVVLVSFGSVLSASELPSDKRDAFVNVLGKLKQKVILKWEKDELPGKPDNVVIKKWLPQRDILAHQNLKLFITHGGLTGLQEATHFGVPLLGIPIFADQFNNIIQARKLGYAEMLKFEDVDEYNLEKLVTDMLSTDRYYKKAKEMSRRFRDRPMSPLDTAIYWIEYVIRHDGADFLRSPGLDMNRLSFEMLDIIIIALLMIMISIVVLMKLIYLYKKIKTDKCTERRKQKTN